MICSIMLAYLRQVGRRDRFKDVWIGVGAAVIVAAVLGIGIFVTIRHYAGSVLQTELESVTYAVAAIILTYMTLWMKRQSRALKAHLHEKMAGALGRGALLTIALIAFITVGREGIETVIFMIAIAFQSSAAFLATGAALGLAAGLTVSYLIYVGGRRINLRHFFNVMGTLLMLFGAGLLADAIEDWQQLGWIAFGRHPLWDTSRYLNENGTLGDILHSFFGYADNPTILQLVLYATYLAVMLYAFWRRPPALRRKSAARPDSPGPGV